MPARPPDPARRIVIAGQAVDYQLRRSSRRTIGLAIDARGLRVGAPLRASLGDIEALIRQHGQWVLDKLDDWRQRPARERLPITDGCVISVLGEPLTVSFTPAPRRDWRRGWQIAPGRLQLALPAGGDANALCETALRAHARDDFARRLAEQAARFGVPTPPLRLSSARTRWGSCSASGRISLNWRLIFLPPALVDYVVIHELAHLREMNHGPRFWSLVGQLCPDWRARRLELRHRGRDIPELSPEFSP